MAIMGRLRFALKMGLIGVLFLVPITALVIFLYQKLAADISSTETERLGVQQVVPSRALVQLLGEHRGASMLALRGDIEAKVKLKGAASGIDEKLKALSALNLNHCAPL